MKQFIFNVYFIVDDYRIGEKVLFDGSIEDCMKYIQKAGNNDEFCLIFSCKLN